MFIRYLALVFGCLALGELAVALTPIPLPSSIIGMLLLTNFWGIMGVIVISTILVIASTGHVYQLFRKRMEFNMKPFNKKHHQK